MWLLNLHVSISILCFLIYFGFKSFFKKNIIENGWLEDKKSNFIIKLRRIINLLFASFIPILNLFIVFVILIMVFVDKTKLEELKKGD